MLRDNSVPHLTPRLKMIADLVPCCDTVCDIGTDHGYVAIYLAKTKVCRNVIAADIKKGPLLQAEKNIALYGADGIVETRLSNGLENIGQNEADCAVIAGMGGETIADILCRSKVSCSYYVLQMQTAHKHLREYLSKNGYVIEKESVCREGSKMYTALLCTKKQSYELTETEKEIGPYLIAHKPPYFYDYVRYRLYEICSVLKKMEKSEVSGEKHAHLLQLKEEYEKLLKGDCNG